MVDLTWSWCCVKGIQGCSKEPAGRELLRLKESLSLKSLHQKQKLQMIYKLHFLIGAIYSCRFFDEPAFLCYNPIRHQEFTLLLVVGKYFFKTIFSL